MNLEISYWYVGYALAGVFTSSACGAAPGSCAVVYPWQIRLIVAAAWPPILAHMLGSLFGARFQRPLK